METRNTKQKQILEKKMGESTSFFDSSDLLKKAKKEDPKIGIATVYRFLNEAEKKKQVYSYMCNRKKIYSLNQQSHCHFRCEKTGKIIHFEIDNLDFLKKIKEKIPGTINSVLIEVKGVCNDCSNKDL